MTIRRTAKTLALVLLLFPSACQTVSSNKTSRKEAYELLSERDFTAAESKFRTAAALASKSEEKAEALVGLGMVYLRGGNPEGAIQQFYKARQVHGQGDVGHRAEKGLGLAYFYLGDCSLARRYLEQGLKACTPEDKQTVLAKLVVCYRASDDLEGAAKYRALLNEPFSSDVKTILASTPQKRRRGGDSNSGPSVATGQCPPDCVECGRANAGSAPPVELPKGTNLQKISVLSRQAWGARPTRSNVRRMLPINKITVHHTGGPDYWGSSRSEAAREINNIQRFHQNQRSWADIGYHYIIDREGHVWQGRPLSYQGAHVSGAYNHGNIGIALLGNFCRQKPTRTQYASLSLLVEKLCTYFRLSPAQVYTHGELTAGSTLCPGPSLTSCVNVIRRNIQRRLVAYRQSAAATQR